MQKYPTINADNFYKKIDIIFNKYKITKEKKSLKEICYPTKFKYQLPQQFVAAYINPATPYKGLLVFHTIGAGKTCAAVNIAEQWKSTRNVIVVTPAALIGNFRNELRTKCAHDEYINDAQRKKLQSLHPSSIEYKNIIKESDKKIDKYYRILSYNKFVTLCQTKKLNLKNSMIIIDEIQNMVSEHGTYYQVLYETLTNAPNDLRIVLLSATPIFDTPIEICLTLNLLRLPVELPIGNEFEQLFLEKFVDNSGLTYYKTKNLDIFKDRIKGYISYFKGAPQYVFPEKRFKYVKCRMEPFQYKSYVAVKNKSGHTNFEGDILNLPKNFFLGLRFISNIAFPNKKINENGFSSLEGAQLELPNLKNYSIKFYKIYKKIKQCTGTVFVYSNFKEYGGIKSFIKVLEYNGFKNYAQHKEGKNRFAIWSGDETVQVKEQIKAVFNNKNNYDGSKIKILLGSPSIKEGVTLLRVKQAHILEPYWNTSRLEQVIGRVVRFCSHKDVPSDERYVDVYMYIATHDDEKETIDQYMVRLAKHKYDLISEFEMALKECAVDCSLNKNANEADIKCDL